MSRVGCYGLEHPQGQDPYSAATQFGGVTGLFIKWFCKRIGKKKLSESHLEGLTFKVVKAFHKNNISLQFQMEECHRLLTDQVDLFNREGHRLVADVSKPLPLGGPPGQTLYSKKIRPLLANQGAVIYKDRNDKKKILRENDVHKFSDGTLTRVLHKLDHMVKEFRLCQYTTGIEYKIWSKDDKRRSKEFLAVIERRLKIWRIFRSLKTFVGGRFRDVDYKTLNRT
nr:hypothetical protein [Tanacetum cinerariifolium]